MMCRSNSYLFLFFIIQVNEISYSNLYLDIVTFRNVSFKHAF